MARLVGSAPALNCRARYSTAERGRGFIIDCERLLPIASSFVGRGRNKPTHAYLARWRLSCDLARPVVGSLGRSVRVESPLVTDPADGVAPGAIRKGIFEIVPLVAFRGAAGGYPILLGFYISHRWGIEALGSFTVAAALIAVGMVVTDFGASRLLPREFATAQPAERRQYVARMNRVRLIVALGVAVLLLAVPAAGAFDARSGAFVTLLIPLCFISIVANNAISERVVSGDVLPILYAVIGGATSIVLLLVVSAFTWDDPRSVAVAFVVGRLVEAVMLSRGRWWIARVETGEQMRHLVALLPFMTQATLGVIYARVAIFVVEHFRSSAELGILSAASGLQSILLLVPTSISLLYYPKLTVAERKNDPAMRRQVLRRYFMLSLGSVALGVAACAAAFPPVARALRIPVEAFGFTVALMAVAAVSVITTICGVLLQAAGGERTAAALSAVTVIAAVAYQSVFVWGFGLWGVVLATVMSEATTVVLFLAALRSLRRRTRIE